MLSLTALLSVFAIVFTIQAARASSSLRQAANQAEALQNQVVNGDGEGAKASLDALPISTLRARDNTDGPLWSIATKVPYFGRNVAAVRTVADVLDNVVDEALPPIVDVSQQVNVNAFSPRHGKVDLANIQRIRPAVAAADRALTAARKDLRQIDAQSLLAPLRGPVATIQYKIDSAQSAASGSNTAAKLMPVMLGRNDTRRYLLLIQNNAEVRATGGIAGSFAIIKAKDGRLSMGQQGSIQDLLPFDEPVTAMMPDERTVFTDQLVKDLRDTNVTPHFPRTGEVTRIMAKKGLDVDVDGVISVDPIALGYILAGTGPVVISDGTTLDQTNVVDVLLNGIYLKYTSNDDQDDTFASAARTIFDVVKAGSGQSRPVIAGMVQAATENRLMLWSSHDKEQAEINGTGLSGAFPSDSGSTPHVGVYFGDGASTHMEYYFDFSTTAVSARCLSGGAQEITTSTELANNAPPGVKKISPSVTGDGSTITKGEMRIYTWLYTPFHGRFTDIRLDGEKQPITTARLAGRSETTVGVTLKPGAGSHPHYDDDHRARAGQGGRPVNDARGAGHPQRPADPQRLRLEFGSRSSHRQFSRGVG